LSRAAGALALTLLALAAAPAAAQDDLGALTYATYCAQCHNDNGDGRGIAAPYLEPPPRDFTSGRYKLRSTPGGYAPTDADLERSIRNGLPGTAMPAFPDLTSAELEAVIAHLKSFSSDFEDPDRQAEPIELSSPPPISDELIDLGREIFLDIEEGKGSGGCYKCHGQLGRGDGPSAPAQLDGWYNDYIRVADLTMPWNFRAGPAREDVFRVLRTGLTGTPMAAFDLPDEKLWAIATYVASLSDFQTEAPYTNLLRAVGADGDLDLARGRELFEGAPESMFPVVGQIMEPGRQFYPGAIAVSARAVYTDDEIAVLLTWHDMRAETTGTNAPDLPAPLWEEEHDVTPGAAPGESAPAPDDPFADFAAGPAAGGGAADPFGDVVAAEPSAEAAVAETREAPGEGGFWDQDTAPAAAGPTGPTAEFSDAVAIQLPVDPPEPGQVVKPYFLLGDPGNPVELWFVDLAEPDRARSYVARGSAAIAAGETDPPEVVASYHEGEWAVIFKARRRRGGRFAEEQFLPISFSVWDGFHRERGNKRGLTQWQYLYLEPRERPSPWGPMLRAGLGVLGLELLVIAWARRRRRAGALPAREPASEPVGPAGAEPARRPA